jgi:hypothetical protein
MLPKNKKLSLFSVAMTNDMALEILPFGTGYFLNEDGDPDSKLLGFAMMLQALPAFNGTLIPPEIYVN